MKGLERTTALGPAHSGQHRFDHLLAQDLHCNSSKIAWLAQIFRTGTAKLPCSMKKSNLTTKDTKSTKFGVIIFRTLRVLRELLRKYM
ncbi:MAG: hypothetical protein ACXW5W_17905, partial [Candidatus Binatia bacterium]